MAATSSAPLLFLLNLINPLISSAGCELSSQFEWQLVECPSLVQTKDKKEEQSLTVEAAFLFLYLKFWW